MKKILPILAVAFLVGCTTPSENSSELASSASEETTSQVASTEVVSSEELISSEVTSSEEEVSSEEASSEETSSEVTSSEEVSSSEEVVSSEEVTSSETQPGLYAADLFISEYIEGTSNNKAIEIANFTGAAVDLLDYTVELYGNGSLTTTRPVQALSGTLQHGEVFVLAGALTADAGMVAALAEIPAERKIISTFEEGSIPASFNGDDAIGLLKNGVLIDVFGTIGFDPGTQWDQYNYQLADGVTAGTQDRTLTRLPHMGPLVGLIESYVAFNPTEWRVDATHYQTLGTHIYS